MIRVGIILVLNFVFSSLFAQVINNNIEERIKLELDSPFVNSTTAGASVQWRCINTKLTTKCLVHHNDQWFYLVPPTIDRYYINVVNQKCKKLKGVQVLVIEGNPCETATYKLLHCTSFTDQNDTFIELDSLKPGVEYLINIDGFLGDLCEFEIQFATTPIGFPNNRGNLDTLALTSSLDQNRVKLRWHATQLQIDGLSRFEIFRMRSTTAKAVMLEEITTLTNALGRHVEDYEYEDGVAEEGTYVYRIMGVQKNTERRFLLDESRVAFYYPKKQYEKIRQIIFMPVNFSYKGDVEILVQDAVADKTLFGVSIKDGRNMTVPLDVTRYVMDGCSFFRVKAKHINSRNVISETFALSENGGFIKVKK